MISSPRIRLAATLLVASGACGGTPAPPPVAAAAPPEPVERQTLLVMPLRGEGDLDTAARALDEMILTAIHGLGRYDVLGPADLSALLGVEQMKDALGCGDVACAAEIGGALGAPYLVAGQLGKLGDQAVLSLRLMDTKAPAVLERASARGGTDGDALATMMASTVGTLFHVELDTPESTGGKSSSVAAPPDYSEYQRVLTELGKQMANGEYTAMLADLDRYEKQTIVSPPNTDLAEILAYYRVNACSTLKKAKCVRQAADRYNATWPDGIYKSSIVSLVDQIDDAALRREAKAGDLEEQLNSFRALRRAGNVSETEFNEMVAYAYFGAQRYEEAGRYFEDLLKEYQRNNPQKAIETVSMLATLLEQAGEFDKARQVLTRARGKFPKLFRLHGLHHHLRRLPR